MIAKMIFAFAFFVVMLLAVNYIHCNMFQVNVVLYSALQDVVISVVISGLASWFVIFRKGIPAIAFLELLIIFGLSGYIYALSIPTIIDRSYSIYILEKLEQQGGKLKQAAFDEAVIQEFTREHRLTDVRLTEQEQSGTVTVTNGCVALTEKGQMVVSFTRWYREHMLPQHRLLMGTYTNDLINPFRQPSQMKDYRCS
jgi:hypothetical protein